jgi:hypothetical protein
MARVACEGQIPIACGKPWHWQDDANFINDRNDYERYALAGWHAV